MNLAELLRQPESKLLEFKRDLSSPQGVLRTIVAFANTGGGTLLIGVEDGTRHVRGVADAIAAEERLVNLIIDGIAPRLLPDIEVLPWRKRGVLAVRVYPSPSRPHHVLQAGSEAGVYVRVGSTNRRADAELIAELRRSGMGLSFDEQPMPELNSEAIDFRAASECFAPVRKLKRAEMESLRLLVAHQGRKVPTVGGMLLFGRDRLAHLPDAWIQAGRFAGADKTAIVDAASLTGPLPAMVEAAMAFVEKHSHQGLAIGRLRHKATPTLPPLALRETLINAVVHADYAQRGAPLRVAVFDDRVEIENPGLLPPGLTLQDLQRGVSRLRNRVLGRVFAALGLIEQWGSGIQRMTSACRDAGLPPPLFEEVGFRFRVTLFSKRTAGHGAAAALNEMDQAVLDALADGAGHSTQDIATHIERTPRTARTRLASLVQRGLVREIGSSPQDPQRRYYKATPD